MQSNEKFITPVTLHFDFYDSLKFFKIEFETESRQRNRIMSIELEGFNLDVCDLVTMHYDLYRKISSQMQEESKKYWDGQPVNDEITGIPTLDYQLKRLFMPVIFFLFSSCLFAQEAPTSFVVFGAQAGYAAKYHSAVGGFFGGYRLNNNYIGLNANIPFTNKRSVPTARAGIVYGYNIGQIQPYISGGYYSCGKEAISEGEGTAGFDFGAGISYYPESLPIKFSVGLNGLDKLSQVKDFTSYANVSIGVYKTF